MPATKPRYHHENLEQILLDAAAQIIATQGVAALSLRALGDRAGVSRSAPYHYFADKDQLLDRLGERGFSLLTQGIIAAQAQHDEPIARGRAGILAYVAFAQAHPQLFRIMFAGILPRRLSLPVDKAGSSSSFSSAAAARAFATLQAGVAALPDSAGLTEADLILRTNALWAAMHGVAVLAIDENLKLVAPETVLDQLLDRLIGPQS